MSKTRQYHIWAKIKERCYNKNCWAYKWYGGAGKLMSDEWRNSFEAFYRDMGPRPSNMTVERIDNEKGYCKENCRWATVKEQMRNTSRSVFVEYNGVKKTLGEWAEMLGISPSLLWHRLNKWGIKRSIEEPLNKKVRTLEFDGKNMIVNDWAKYLGCHHDALYSRLSRGWTIERTLTTPVISRKKK